MKSILDPSFRYTASFDTDLHKTFARIRHEQRREAGGGAGDRHPVGNGFDDCQERGAGSATNPVCNEQASASLSMDRQ